MRAASPGGSLRRKLQICVSTRFSTATVFQALEIISALEKILGLPLTRKASRANSRPVRLSITFPPKLIIRDSVHILNSSSVSPSGAFPRSISESSADRCSLLSGRAAASPPQAGKGPAPVKAFSGSTNSNTTSPGRLRRKDADKGLAAAVMFISAGYPSRGKFFTDPATGRDRPSGQLSAPTAVFLPVRAITNASTASAANAAAINIVFRRII